MIDGSTGTRHDVVIGGDAAGKSEAARPPHRRPSWPGSTQRLLEKSRYGMIPMVAGDLKPFNVYAADADRAKAAKMPVVAILIGGLGVGAAKTTDAIMRLPPAVTLAFTPYGSDPGKLAERARAQRHEIFLQIPMEPYDFPDNDPGPQTLLTSLSADQNMDRLYWHLSRMQGYAGLTNFMGARFIATEPAMQPIIREAAKRGLGFFDDGSSPRSIAPQAAGSLAMPFGKGDIAIDAVPTPAEIDRALTKLEAAGARARRRRRHRLRAPGLDRADRRLDQDIERPGYPFGAIDNRDAEIKIQLNQRIGTARARGTAQPCRQHARGLAEWRVTRICPTGPASA